MTKPQNSPLLTWPLYVGVLRIFGCWLRFSRFAIFKVGVDISMSHPMCITNVTFFSSMLSCPFPPLSIAKVQGPSTLPRAVAPEGLKSWWGQTMGLRSDKTENRSARRRFVQKTNKRIYFVCREKQKSKQTKFIRSFFGRIYCAPICFSKLTDL